MHRLQCVTRFRIEPDRLDDFARQAAACMEAARTNQTGAVRYDIFLDAKALQAASYEEFETSQAATAHLELMSDLAKATGAPLEAQYQVWGNPDPALASCYKALGASILEPLLRLSA